MIAESILNEVISDIDLLEDSNKEEEETNLNENLVPVSNPNIEKTRSKLQFTCGECNLKTQEKDEMDRHVKQHKENDESILKEYICSICKKVFDKEEDYNSHLLMHAQEKQKIFDCGDCNLSFQSNTEYGEHNTGS